MFYHRILPEILGKLKNRWRWQRWRIKFFILISAITDRLLYDLSTFFVFNKLCSKADHHLIVQHDLCLQHLVVIQLYLFSICHLLFRTKAVNTMFFLNRTDQFHPVLYASIFLKAGFYWTVSLLLNFWSSFFLALKGSLATVFPDNNSGYHSGVFLPNFDYRIKSAKWQYNFLR